MSLLEYEVVLPCTPEGLFEFLSRPANVSLVSDPSLGIKFTAAPEILHQGARVDFQIVTFGQVVKSSHAITTYEKPLLIVEQQVAGPMKAWTHRHEYSAVPAGVKKRDVVEFQLPGGLIGLLLSEDKVKDHLEDGFFYRDERLRELISRGRLT